MARIAFKAKPETVYDHDRSPAWVQLKVPSLERRHCDMAAFRQHPKFGGLANSDLFKGILARISRDVAPNGYLRMDRLPENVTVHAGAFLWNVHIEV